MPMQKWWGLYSTNTRFVQMQMPAGLWVWNENLD